MPSSFCQWYTDNETSTSELQMANEEDKVGNLKQNRLKSGTCMSGTRSGEKEWTCDGASLCCRACVVCLLLFIMDCKIHLSLSYLLTFLILICVVENT